LFLIGWALIRIWEEIHHSVTTAIYGKVHWLNSLPLHLRRGLLRLYIAVSVPWIAFFGYRFLDALQYHYRHQPDPAEAFLYLLIVPVGGPILLLVIMWVRAGFNNSEQSDVTPGVKVDPRSSQPPPQSRPRESSPDTPNYTGAGKVLGRIFLNPTFGTK